TPHTSPPSLHDALPISCPSPVGRRAGRRSCQRLVFRVGYWSSGLLLLRAVLPPLPRLASGGCEAAGGGYRGAHTPRSPNPRRARSEEHTAELQSRGHLV